MTTHAALPNRSARIARWAAIAGGVLMLAVAGLALGAGERPSPRQHTVAIQGAAFVPAELSVAVGDTIVWVNRDLFPHTATAPDGAFDSGRIEAGASWTYTARAAGVASYVCLYHPSMKATLRVR